MIRIALENVQVEVAGAPDGSRMLTAIDPQSGIMVNLGFTREGAADVGRAMIADTTIVPVPASALPRH